MFNNLTVEFYSAIKKNEVMKFPDWMDLEIILCTCYNYITQTQKDKFSMFTHMLILPFNIYMYIHGCECGYRS